MGSRDTSLEGRADSAVSVESATASGAASRIRIGVSSCLAGQPVRYDGGHKLDRSVAQLLAAQFELVPVCPEVEAGMGVPREPVQLVRGGDDVVRMLGVRSRIDHTDAMQQFARARVAGLARSGICGYVLKTGSPSCGAREVPVSSAAGTASAASGLFAAELLRAMPELPVVEEDRLADEAALDAFARRVRECARKRSCQRRY
ncbi:MAG TPA: DUF523 domain-containing protein [Candidatus Binatia bacterium]